LRGDVNRLERVQRKANKRMEGFDGISYMDRLQELGLMTLETRRIMANLIEVFKNLRGMAGAVEGLGHVRDDGGRRVHDHNLYINSVKLDLGKFMFSNRVCQQWNDLPGEVVGAGSVNWFKRGGVDKILRGQ